MFQAAIFFLPLVSKEDEIVCGKHKVHIGLEEKYGDFVECISPFSWSVHHNFVHDGTVDIVKGGGRAPPTLPMLG
jgi:hypothetical protein